ncbi:unnamed protein product [Phytophthora lilii]|uniref:Unnamed protein product n=1 Tax=Phytophthora lilii TaxID=2077276 RepID=A0A9W6WT15_9STRA|nr:unnamed protein product [Phytophthora lilii]
MDEAAANGHLTVVKWLHSHRDEGCSKNALVDACYADHASVAKWLMQFRYGGIDAAIDAATHGGHYELV